MVVWKEADDRMSPFSISPLFDKPGKSGRPIKSNITDNESAKMKTSLCSTFRGDSLKKGYQEY
jgi:hypothetical protein